jgi:hypothetical protein
MDKHNRKNFTRVGSGLYTRTLNNLDDCKSSLRALRRSIRCSRGARTIKHVNPTLRIFKRGSTIDRRLHDNLTKAAVCVFGRDAVVESVDTDPCGQLDAPSDLFVIDWTALAPNEDMDAVHSMYSDGYTRAD